MRRMLVYTQTTLSPIALLVRTGTKSHKKWSHARYQCKQQTLIKVTDSSLSEAHHYPQESLLSSTDPSSNYVKTIFSCSISLDNNLSLMDSTNWTVLSKNDRSQENQFILSIHTPLLRITIPRETESSHGAVPCQKKSQGIISAEIILHLYPLEILHGQCPPRIQDSPIEQCTHHMQKIYFARDSCLKGPDMGTTCLLLSRMHSWPTRTSISQHMIIKSPQLKIKKCKIKICKGLPVWWADTGRLSSLDLKSLVLILPLRPKTNTQDCKAPLNSNSKSAF